MLLGGGSCASGPSEIEASLESAPYTTYTTTFTILPPQPTLPVSPEFTIEKLQRLEGEATFTKSELTGSVGQTVEYEIVVRNTGNTPLQFSHFQDARCEGISGGPGEKPLQPGQVTTFTCTHRLTAPGTWTNAATIEGNEGTGKKESNEVVVKVPTIPPTPEFTIEKLQRIDETGSFTKNELTGAIGQVVNYQIIVRNTGTVTIQLSNFKDEHCEGIAGGASELAPGHSTTFTCHHTLTTVGVWTNVATVEGGGMKKESNEVVVKVPQKNEPAYTIEKLQRIEETGSFTKEELTGMIGQTVSYEIIVNNVGNVTLTFKNFVDTECEGITGGPGPSGEIKSGQSATWTCFHVLTSTGTWPNVAKIEGNLGHGPQRIEQSRRQRTAGTEARDRKAPDAARRTGLHRLRTDRHDRPGRQLRDRGHERRQRAGEPVELHRHPVRGDQRRRPGTRRRRLHDLHLHAPDHEHRPVRERGGRRRHSAPRPGCSREGGIQPGGRQSRRIAAGPQHRAERRSGIGQMRRRARAR